MFTCQVILLKKFIFSVHFVFKLFLQEILTNFVMNFFYRKLLSILLQNILYKIIFTTNFVENTYNSYNFVGNNYPRRNYLSINILRKNSRKKCFIANFFNKFAKKISCNMRIFSSVNIVKHISTQGYIIIFCLIQSIFIIFVIFV